ncbi:polar amino acid transport system permease protein [Brevinema andersonii]|uniref:Putative glutamine transport system permease protein GlnP n=1 Tax=Brevinema andersonii TaxID=34097 RepID=A0A1I1EPV4_BREAD|nr:amino acid ABC transporter permease [Brevinema andersonii]SFB89134.1 polar amino acid transport system permease protein [Brevinema andersonii]
MDYLLTLKHLFIEHDRYLYVLHGLQFSLSATLLAAVLGILLGIISALFNISHYKFLRFISILYTDVIRGTPVVVQLMILANVVFIGILRDVPILFVSSLAFGINSGAYVSEIIRAGIQSIDKGQMDAAQALGMSYYTAMKEIIIPQAVKKILPPLVSELITLLKETSVVGFIGGVDLLRAANIITSQTYRGIEPLLLVGLIYLMLTSIFTKLMRQIEKRLSISD